MDQVTGIGQSEPTMSRGEVELCPGQWERDLFGAEREVETRERKSGRSQTFLGYG
jgi:hypothetical protein